MSRRFARKERRAAKRQRRRQRRLLRLRQALALLAVAGAGVLIGFRGGVASYLLFWATLLPPLYARHVPCAANVWAAPCF